MWSGRTRLWTRLKADDEFLLIFVRRPLNGLTWSARPPPQWLRPQLKPALCARLTSCVCPHGCLPFSFAVVGGGAEWRHNLRRRRRKWRPAPATCGCGAGRDLNWRRRSMGASCSRHDDKQQVDAKWGLLLTNCRQEARAARHSCAGAGAASAARVCGRVCASAPLAAPASSRGARGQRR